MKRDRCNKSDNYCPDNQNACTGRKIKNQLIKYSPVFKKLQLLHVEHYLRIVLLFCRGACECLSAVLRAECGRDDS